MLATPLRNVNAPGNLRAGSDASSHRKVRSLAIALRRAGCRAAIWPLAITLGACTGVATRVHPSATVSPAVALPPPAAVAKAEKPVATFADGALASWLAARLPKGGELSERDDRSIAVVHAVQARQSVADIAVAYVELTTVYLAEDLAEAIRGKNQLTSDAVAPDTRIEIPAIVETTPKPPSEGRLGWPDDKMLRGLHIRPQVAAGRSFPRVLDAMAARGMNLVVIDVKDADGKLSYPSKVPLANEIGAVPKPSIRHLWRTIRLAHDHGIRVAMRIVCFMDLALVHARDDLSVQSVRGRPLRIGWVDPANEVVQKYLLDLAAEAVEAGADEIQMDYVRYPVEKVANADFRLKERGLRKTNVIADFVHRVHELTQAKGASLSIDIFGIVAEGVKTDLENLGQDPALLARECDALAPMLYPSHYPKGFMGFEEPGDHPELVRVGVTKLLALIRRGGKRSQQLALVRPWIQGMPYHAASFGPQYIAQQVNHANKAGASGWMVWNPSQNFTDTWQAIAAPRLGDQPTAR
jgi:hypothetical protein